MSHYPSTEAALSHLSQHTKQLLVCAERLEEAFALAAESVGAELTVITPESHVESLGSSQPWLARIVHETDLTKEQLAEAVRPMFDAMRRIDRLDRAIQGKRFVDGAALAGVDLEARIATCEAANPSSPSIEGHINSMLEDLIDPCGRGCECPCDDVDCATVGVAHSPLPCRDPLPWPLCELGGGRWDRDDLQPMLPERLWPMPATA